MAGIKNTGSILITIFLFALVLSPMIPCDATRPIDHPARTSTKAFPGPTIRAKAGDTIVVELTNRLHTEGVVIHWHGIRQIGTPWADGTASISQCAINPGESFEYRFKVDRLHFSDQKMSPIFNSSATRSTYLKAPQI
ncbi:Cupredoxin [Corchorus capsularis]|uniref:Cupredoxin n=1 Tax=Corchorus capsularis TaxID=210143 RepID=A0A1R3HL00_COCAP|nr:Cupredoxin [Corchorus capsularis]